MTGDEILTFVERWSSYVPQFYGLNELSQMEATALVLAPFDYETADAAVAALVVTIPKPTIAHIVEQMRAQNMPAESFSDCWETMRELGQCHPQSPDRRDRLRTQLPPIARVVVERLGRDVWMGTPSVVYSEARRVWEEIETRAAAAPNPQRTSVAATAARERLQAGNHRKGITSG